MLQVAEQLSRSISVNSKPKSLVVTECYVIHAVPFKGDLLCLTSNILFVQQPAHSQSSTEDTVCITNRSVGWIYYVARDLVYHWKASCKRDTRTYGPSNSIGVSKSNGHSWNYHVHWNCQSMVTVKIRLIHYVRACQYVELRLMHAGPVHSLLLHNSLSQILHVVSVYPLLTFLTIVNNLYTVKFCKDTSQVTNSWGTFFVRLLLKFIVSLAPILVAMAISRPEV